MLIGGKRRVAGEGVRWILRKGCGVRWVGQQDGADKKQWQGAGICVHGGVGIMRWETPLNAGGDWAQAATPAPRMQSESLT